MTVGELIERLGGELIRGYADMNVFRVGSPDGAGQTVLTFGENASDASLAVSRGAGAAVVAEGYDPEAWNGWTSVISAKQPRLWFAKAGKLLESDVPNSGIHASAVIGADVSLGQGISIGAGVVVGLGSSIGAFTRIDAGAVVGDLVHIGEHCQIAPRAVIYPGTTIGDRVVVHGGVVLGADGFGYVRDKVTGTYTQFPQVGHLVIEDDVEIGANSTIDRGALRETRIRRGTKIDNLVHIGHNCDIGEDVVIAALTGISGSSTVGNGAVIAGQVGIGDHAHVGPGVILGGQAGVLSGKTVSVTGTVLWGTPAKPLREYLRELATLSRLARRKRD